MYQFRRILHVLHGICKLSSQPYYGGWYEQYDFLSDVLAGSRVEVLLVVVGMVVVEALGVVAEMTEVGAVVGQ